MAYSDDTAEYMTTGRPSDHWKGFTNRQTPDMANADYDVPRWHEDPDELIAFMRWYFAGYTSPRIKSEIFEVLENPEHFEDEYQGYREEKGLSV